MSIVIAIILFIITGVFAYRYLGKAPKSLNSSEEIFTIERFGVSFLIPSELTRVNPGDQKEAWPMSAVDPDMPEYGSLASFSSIPKKSMAKECTIDFGTAHNKSQLPLGEWISTAYGSYPGDTIEDIKVGNTSGVRYKSLKSARIYYPSANKPFEDVLISHDDVIFGFNIYIAGSPDEITEQCTQIFERIVDSFHISK